MEAIYLALFVLILLQGTYFVLLLRLPERMVSKSALAQTPSLTPTLNLHGMDWWLPKIKITNPSKQIAYSSTDFILESDEKVTLANLPAGWSWLALAGDTAPFHYIIKTAAIPNGTSTYELNFTDLNQNQVAQTVSITGGAGRPAVAAWPDSTYHSYGDDLLAIANKKFRLPEDYVPAELVQISAYGIAGLPGAQMRREAAEALRNMTQAMSKAGISNYVRSAYRSYVDQVNVYSYWVNYNGSMAGADRISARPGHSEHQLGTTADFGTSSFETFGTTPGARWLRDHAHEYGFVMSYPEGKESITGYAYEPWHYRYIGVENARQVRDSGFTLTEWLYKYWKVAQ